MSERVAARVRKRSRLKKLEEAAYFFQMGAGWNIIDLMPIQYKNEAARYLAVLVVHAEETVENAEKERGHAES